MENALALTRQFVFKCEYNWYTIAHMTFASFVQTHKPHIEEYILHHLQEKKKYAMHLTSQQETTTKKKNYPLSFYTNVLDKLLRFVTKGKMLRGLLVLLTYELYAHKKPRTILPAAAAIELTQSGLLIQDDIMDNDLLRRGGKTIYAQYQQEGKKKNIEHVQEYAQAMGMCAGDISMTMAYDLLTQLPIDTNCMKQAVHFFSQEVELVGAAQMADMHVGITTEEPSPDQIRTIYTYKTARYSFCLPLVLGAMLAHADPKEQNNLLTLGVSLGLIFQIRDDDIKLFSSVEQLGTDVGSDIRENKKTLHRALLLSHASPKQKKHLSKLYGKKDISSEEIQEVKKVFEKHAIRKIIEKEIQDHMHQAGEIIQSLSISKQAKETLKGLSRFCGERNK